VKSALSNANIKSYSNDFPMQFRQLSLEDATNLIKKC